MVQLRAFFSADFCLCVTPFNVYTLFRAICYFTSILLSNIEDQNPFPNDTLDPASTIYTYIKLDNDQPRGGYTQAQISAEKSS